MSNTGRAVQNSRPQAALQPPVRSGGPSLRSSPEYAWRSVRRCFCLWKAGCKLGNGRTAADIVFAAPRPFLTYWAGRFTACVAGGDDCHDYQLSMPFTVRSGRSLQADYHRQRCNPWGGSAILPAVFAKRLMVTKAQAALWLLEFRLKNSLWR